MINARQRDRLEGLVSDAADQGATVATGGGRPGDRDQGYFFEPTVVTDITPEFPVYHEELFGPVMPVVDFGDLDEAIALANDTRLRPGVLRLDQRPALGHAGRRAARVRHGRGQRVDAATAPRAPSPAGSRAASAASPGPRASRSTSRPSSSRWAAWARSMDDGTRSLVVRVWLPDRPGALGAVASRIGGVGGRRPRDRGRGPRRRPGRGRVPGDRARGGHRRPAGPGDRGRRRRRRRGAAGRRLRRARPPHRRPGDRGRPQRGGGRPGPAGRRLAERVHHELRAVWAAVIGPDGVEAVVGDGPEAPWLSAFGTGVAAADGAIPASPPTTTARWPGPPSASERRVLLAGSQRGAVPPPRTPGAGAPGPPGRRPLIA